MIEAAKNAVDALAAVPVDDRESAHIEADKILLTFVKEIGHIEVYEAYRAAKAATGGFWYA